MGWHLKNARTGDVAHFGEDECAAHLAFMNLDKSLEFEVVEVKCAFCVNTDNHSKCKACDVLAPADEWNHVTVQDYWAYGDVLFCVPCEEVYNEERPVGHPFKHTNGLYVD